MTQIFYWKNTLWIFRQVILRHFWLSIGTRKIICYLYLDRIYSSYEHWIACLRIVLWKRYSIVKFYKVDEYVNQKYPVFILCVDAEYDRQTPFPLFRLRIYWIIS